MFSSSKAEILNQFFSECFNSCSPPIVSYPVTLLSCLSLCPPDSLCSESEVFGLISRFLLPQPLVQIQFLLECLYSHYCSPHSLIQLVLVPRTCTADWKTCFIVPIHKYSSSLDNPSNYRPISLLSIISKLLENMFTLLSFTNSISIWLLPNRSTSPASLFASHCFHCLQQPNKSVGAYFLISRRPSTPFLTNH